VQVPLVLSPVQVIPAARHIPRMQQPPLLQALAAQQASPLPPHVIVAPPAPPAPPPLPAAPPEPLPPPQAVRVTTNAAVARRRTTDALHTRFFMDPKSPGI
jgi:hypothetical protein